MPKISKNITHPYDWYCYKNHDADKCPECGSLPRDYHIPRTHIAIISRATFECAFGHTWLAPKLPLDK